MEEKGRRCYEKGLCPFHQIVQDQIDKSLPRWVFLSAFGSLITIAIVFASWHINSLEAYDAKYQKQVLTFNELAQKNKELLIEVRTTQKEILKKLDRF